MKTKILLLILAVVFVFMALPPPAMASPHQIGHDDMTVLPQTTDAAPLSNMVATAEWPPYSVQQLMISDPAIHAIKPRGEIRWSGGTMKACISTIASIGANAKYTFSDPLDWKIAKVDPVVKPEYTSAILRA